MFGVNAASPPGSPFVALRSETVDRGGSNPFAPPPQGSSQYAGLPPIGPLPVARSGLFLGARLWRVIKAAWFAICAQVLFGVMALVLAFFLSSLLKTNVYMTAAVLGAPLALVYGVWGVSELLFAIFGRIELSEQTIQGRGRMVSQTVRERSGNSELAYQKTTTRFKTIESGDFVFQTEGYHELRPGDRVLLRVYRWRRSGPIKEYDILHFNMQF